MSRQNMRLLALGVGAVILLGCGVYMLASAASQADAPLAQVENTNVDSPAPSSSAPVVLASSPTTAPLTPEEQATRQSIEQAIGQAPEIARFFDRLHLTLPGDYDAILANLVRASTEPVTPDYALSEAVKALRQSHGALGAKADGPTLARVFAGQLAVMKALSARNPHLCVDFLYGGASDGFFKFSADNRALVSDLASAGLEAILDGRQKNIKRPAPSESDFETFEKILREKGLSQVEIDALLDGKTPDLPLEDTRMCAAGQTYLETLATLPEDVRQRIEALAIDLMARS